MSKWLAELTYLLRNTPLLPTVNLPKSLLFIVLISVLYTVLCTTLYPVLYTVPFTIIYCIQTPKLLERD